MMKKPEVIVFVIADSLRYDVCYPGIKKLMPYLSSCSTHFHQVRSPACWTLPSHASMFSGLWPHTHGANTQIRKVRKDYPVLAEQLKSKGYYTAMITTNVVVTDIFGVNRGFDETHKIWKEIPDQGAQWLYAMLGYLWRPRFRKRVVKTFISRKQSDDIENLRIFFRGYGPDIFTMARERIETLRKKKKKKIFLFLNFYDTHFPYHTQDRFTLDAPGLKKIPEFMQLIDVINNTHLMKNNYQPNMRIMPHIKDRQRRAFERFAPMMDSFAQWIREEIPNSTIVFGSDHGENFGEEQWLYHFANVTEGGNRVPLLWSSSGQTRKKEIKKPVSLMNVYNSFCYETGAGQKKDRWHLVQHPEKSLSVIQAYWYNANGKTAPIFKRNQFAFNTDRRKYIYRDNTWYEIPVDNDSKTHALPLSNKTNPVEEVRMSAQLKKDLLKVWNEYQAFERTVPF